MLQLAQIFSASLGASVQAQFGFRLNAFVPRVWLAVVNFFSEYRKRNAVRESSATRVYLPLPIDAELVFAAPANRQHTHPFAMISHELQMLRYKSLSWWRTAT